MANYPFLGDVLERNQVDSITFKKSRGLTETFALSFLSDNALPSGSVSQEVKAKHPKIIYADLYQGLSQLRDRGPTIDFVPGHKDSLVSINKGLLPEATKGVQHLKDEEAFFEDYAASHKKLSVLAFTPIFQPSKLAGTQGIVAVIAAAVVILSYFYDSHPRVNK